MLKRILLFIFVPLIAWVPMIVWVTSDLWSPRVFGGDVPYPGDGRPISTAITIGLVVLIVGVSFLAVIAEFSLAAFEKRRKRKLLRTGLTAKAKVISISGVEEGASIKINGQPLLSFVLEVKDERGKVYTVKIDDTIPFEAIPCYQPGSLVDVKVDKDNPNNIALVL